MPFKDTYDSDELALLTDVLSAHCARSGIRQGSGDYHAAAGLVMAFYRSGITTRTGLLDAMAARQEGQRLAAT